MFHRRKEFLRLRLALSDTAVTAVAFEAAYVLRQHLPAFREFYLHPGIMAGLLVAVLLIWVAAGSAIGLYQMPNGSSLGRTARGLLRQTAWSTAALTCLIYLLKLGDLSRLFMLLFVGINLLLLFAWRVSAPALGRAATGGPAKTHYVIVGTGEQAAYIAGMIESDGAHAAEVLAFVRCPEELEEQQPYLGRALPSSELRTLLKGDVVDEVIFAVERERTQNLEELFLICQEEGVKVRVVVNLFPNMASEIVLDRLYDLPLLTFCAAPDNDYLLFLKRIFDVSVAGCMLTVMAPVSLLVIAAVRLTSKGPVLFVQERCGLNGRRFQLYKFRSMYEDAPMRRGTVASLNEMDGPVFKCANDPRITPLGRYLRKFSIDEWPQLLNVIKGDMSLVGPRPPLPEEVEQYKPWQRRRLRMRPGLTCLWVLEGRNKLDFLSWMRLDLQYIDHWSLALDCKILVQSIPHVLSGKGL